MENYYLTQAGSGVSGFFSGQQYQKGYGFFGRLLSSAVMPILRFLGKSVLNTGANIASDIVDTDDFSLNNVKDISKKRLREATKDALKKGANKILSGSGLRKRRKRRKLIKDMKPFKKGNLKRRRNKSKKKIKHRRAPRSIKAQDFLTL